jgi:hypothetical protein
MIPRRLLRRALLVSLHAGLAHYSKRTRRGSCPRARSPPFSMSARTFSSGTAIVRYRGERNLMSKSVKRFALLGGLVTVLVAASVTTTVAVVGGPDPQGPSDSTATATLVDGSGGELYAVRVNTQNTPFTTTSSTYVTYMTVSVPVPPGRTVLINADFMAETACSGGGTDPAWCRARIDIGGVEAHPKADADSSTFALDSTDSGSETENSWEGHAMSRCRRVRNTSGATVSVPVEVRLRVQDFNAAPPTFWVDDSKLEARAHRAGAGCL